ncbi:winged helix-turn-helix transcriptional regulator [Pontibacter ummariensis]|nr:helix-turn-helix domain-containing protein [Pontibacter ummariensis]
MEKCEKQAECPIENLLKSLSGKWKPLIFRYATTGPMRFSSLLRQMPEANKQSLTVALREMEELGLLERKVIRQKPLHVEYHITDHGRALIPIFESLEQFS